LRLPETGLPSDNLYSSPVTEGDLSLATNNGLFHSTDSGAGLHNIGSVQLACNLGFGKSAPRGRSSALYLSEQVKNLQAIFRSADGGTTWARNDDHHQWGSLFTTMAIRGFRALHWD
jgi:xyloglucan-specific exo-beta-1,4-glucanase